jgi:predicted RNase H-like HicB family nuclease
MRTYTVILEYDAEVGAYGVRVPALPGCYSQGASVEEALANAGEAIRGHIAALEQIGAPVPEEDAAVARDALAAVEPAQADERVLLSRVAA